MRVVALDPVHDHAFDAEHNVTRLSLDELLAGSDFVSLHVPLTPETRHLIDARALGRMKPTAALINTSRGPVVDEPALVEALRLAFADTQHFVADPAITPVPVKELLSKEYMAKRAALFDPASSGKVFHVCHGRVYCYKAYSRKTLRATLFTPRTQCTSA